MKVVCNDTQLGLTIKPPVIGQLKRNQHILNPVKTHTDLSNSLQTLAHQVRVAKLMEMIGKHMGFSPAQQRILHNAGAMHDLGKQSVPQDVLYQTGKLSAFDRAVVQMHPVLGYNQLVSVNPGIHQEIKEAVLFHHERYDGSGYPYGLKGRQIPAIARLMAVADTYDALISERSYKQAYSHETAMKVIQDASGEKFDPQVVGLFDSMFIDQSWHAQPERKNAPLPLVNTSYRALALN